MLKFLGLLLLTVAAAWPQSPLGSAQLNGEEKQALQFVNQAEQELLEATREFVKIQWAYASNITDYNEQKQLEYTVSRTHWSKNPDLSKNSYFEHSNFHKIHIFTISFFT